MTDLDNGQSNLEDAPAEPQPASEAPSFDPEELKTALAAEFEKRFRGLQGLMEKKTSELNNEISQLRAANLSPEEQEQLEVRSARERAEYLERENAMLRLRKDYPEEVDFMENFFKAESMQDQLAALANFRKATAPQGNEPVEERPTPTPVSGNNPARRQSPTLADTGAEMNDALADSVLNAAGNQRGILRRLFNGG